MQTNYLYNSRHLPTNISYQPGSGVADTPDVAFAYDAAGNRTSMTDATGTTAYRYDMLSRLEWEERQFTEWAGAHRLTYGYNLAGSVTSVTYPGGARVDYVYDAANRLGEVNNGSGFGSTPHLAHEVKYRAWNGMSEMTYGNGLTFDLSYDRRLRPKRYELAGLQNVNGQPLPTAGSDYTYHADGRLNYVQDLSDGRFDRKYLFDQVGRLKEAFSGQEARGGAPTDDRPYRQTFVYDEWGNTTGRTGFHWSGAQSDTAAYTNHRRDGWGHDAAGNITQDTWEHAYDAAGDKTRAHKEWVESGGNQFDYHKVTIEQAYDGAGAPARRVETRALEDETGPRPAEVTTSFYLRSSVLGGAVLLELKAEGLSERRVYAWGRRLAEYTEGQSPALRWRHADPLTGSWVEAFDRRGTRREVDALGADVGLADPYVTTTWGAADLLDLWGAGSLFDGVGDPYDIRGGCGTIDGMPAACADVAHRVDTGTAALTGRGASGSRWPPGRASTWVYCPDGHKGHRRILQSPPPAITGSHRYLGGKIRSGERPLIWTGSIVASTPRHAPVPSRVSIVTAEVRSAIQYGIPSICGTPPISRAIKPGLPTQKFISHVGMTLKASRPLQRRPAS